MTPFVRLCFCSLLLVGAAGCPQYRDPRVPNPIEPTIESDLGGEYLLYTPSTYDVSRSWPLIVVCHGTRPWDTPLRQIRCNLCSSRQLRRGPVRDAQDPAPPSEIHRGNGLHCVELPL